MRRSAFRGPTSSHSTKSTDSTQTSVSQLARPDEARFVGDDDGSTVRHDMRGHPVRAPGFAVQPLSGGVGAGGGLAGGSSGSWVKLGDKPRVAKALNDCGLVSMRKLHVLELASFQ